MIKITDFHLSKASTYFTIYISKGMVSLFFTTYYFSNVNIALNSMTNENIPFLQFRISIARTYTSHFSTANLKTAGRPCLQKQITKRIPGDVRNDPVGHYLERTVEGKEEMCSMQKQC